MSAEALIETEEEAGRLASAMIDDAERLAGGDRGAREASLVEARALFRSRVAPRLHPAFETALALRSLRDIGAPALPPRPARAWLRPGLGWLAIAAVGVGFVVLLRLRGPQGVEVGRVAIPGALEVEVAAGSRLTFTADTDVLIRDLARNARPSGCRLEVVLVQGEREAARTSCDLYSSGHGAGIARASSTSEDPGTGMRRLVVEGQWLTCELTAPAGGRSQVRTSSNLESCVPRALGAVAHVFSEAP